MKLIPVIKGETLYTLECRGVTNTAEATMLNIGGRPHDVTVEPCKTAQVKPSFYSISPNIDTMRNLNLHKAKTHLRNVLEAGK